MSNLTIKNWLLPAGSYNDAELTTLIEDINGVTIAALVVTNTSANAGTFSIAIADFYLGQTAIDIVVDKALGAGEQYTLDMRSLNLLGGQLLKVSSATAADIGFLASGVIDSSVAGIPEYKAARVFGSADPGRAFVLDFDGTIYGAGGNYDSTLGIGDGLYEEIQVFTPTTTALAISQDPLRIGDFSMSWINTYFINDDNATMHACGYSGGNNTCDVDNPPVYLDDFTQFRTPAKYVTAQEYMVMFIGTDDKLYAVGDGGWGQFGQGDYESYEEVTELSFPGATPVAVESGWYHAVVLDSDGKIWGAGADWNGQLAGAGAGGDVVTWTELDLNNFANELPSALYTGLENTFYTLRGDEGATNQGVYGCGANYNWTCGCGDTDDTDRVEFERRSNPRSCVKIVSSYYSTFFLDNDGTLYCCGSNYDFIFGDAFAAEDAQFNITEFTTQNSDDTYKDVAVTDSSTLVINQDDVVRVAGSGDYGDSGLNYNVAESFINFPVPGTLVPSGIN
ncbi:regulator of chromosome condensation 1/beta-lactamase-inhibitor protein II [Vibrio phage 1.139.A._10N.261.48.C6]|nr:regulator of chromosome condensation 1/beta-lactamase-inhibitor protein II [Vibrio phage 1.034.O._10N.261.46.B7]AUR83437.1 regulator of chromosome condensation 1/beta-lactamase-inhibitor protein II [Vibrio phage 1.034.X._10N.261.46.B7]AUR90175.1 regulator of chromosome condensation 1/beta-lactamase-inhibitor protein II [Vibrio phage 1.139.A._10N.261.48.C6]AUR90242.1 regulator of chromosome condensation 1/beta-lactamase-inhibitor protein II [Vibrio phage 1.139.B._10N.261.48.C6]